MKLKIKFAKFREVFLKFCGLRYGVEILRNATRLREIQRRLNFTARNFGGIEFRGANFNGTKMEFYRDAEFYVAQNSASRQNFKFAAQVAQVKRRASLTA